MISLFYCRSVAWLKRSGIQGWLTTIIRLDLLVLNPGYGTTEQVDETN
jgi:hypothetical protein